jgi:hypothetical protein
MKRFSLVFVLIATAPFCHTGCSKEDVPSTSSENIEPFTTNNFVEPNQVYTYLARNHPLTKSDPQQTYSVAPYRNATGDTLMYIVNYPDNTGWQILSSDSRTPAVIAEGETGRFSIEDGSPAVQVWLDMTARDMEAVKTSRDEDLNFSPEEIAAHKSLWGVGNSKGLDDRDFTLGHWEETTTEYVEVLDKIEHMTPHWDQDAPYNAFCPLQSNSTTERAPAGCVAIAAAEVLYYLHNKWNVPEYMVDEGFCTGNVNSYSRSFSGSSSAVWAAMDTTNHSINDPAPEEAIMIGHIGDVIGMTYHNDYSYALPANIRTQLFPLHGISCSHGDYDSSDVVSNMNNLLPVIVTATNLLVPLDFNIHCFVIDGYKRTRIVYRTYHYWVSDDPNNKIVPPWYQPYETYTYSSPVIRDIKINWGWWTQWTVPPVNDGWYGLTADWTVTCNGSTYSYNYWVSMIYDLSITNNQ